MWIRSDGGPSDLNGTLILLTDGTVLAQRQNGADWARLTPNRRGSYRDGRWTAGPSMVRTRGFGITSVAPLLPGTFVAFRGSDISILSVGGARWSDPVPIGDSGGALGYTICSLPDGSVLAIAFDETLNSVDELRKWTPADGLSLIGDLPDLFTPGDPSADTAIACLTPLPDGSVLALGRRNAFRFLPREARWITEGSHGISYDADNVSGPLCLLPDGSVFACGEESSAVENAVLSRDLGVSWSPVHPIPARDGVDGEVEGCPACVLASGHVLVGVGYAPPTGEYVTYYEWDPLGGWNNVAAAPPDERAADLEARSMILLPDQSVMVARGDAAFYVPPHVDSAPWGPVITSVGEMARDAIVLTPFGSYLLKGRRLTGAGQACYGPYYYANPTNYPLARLEYPDGSVWYLTTSNHSTLGVGTSDATQGTTITVGDVPEGAARLCVVTNGIADCVPVRIERPHPRRFPGYQQLVGSLADGQLWVFINGQLVPTPPGPNDGRIIDAYERILAGIEQLSRADAHDPFVDHDAQRVPGVNQILSGIRTLRSAGAAAEGRDSNFRNR